MTTEPAASGARSASSGPPRAIPLTLVAEDEVDSVLDGLGAAHTAWARDQGFAGKLGQRVALPDPGGTGVDAWLVGWGTAESRGRDWFHLGGFARTAPAGAYRLTNTLDPATAETEALGWLLARYRFDKYKTAPDRAGAHLMSPPGINPLRLQMLAEGIFFTRDLINTPANDMGPQALEDACRRIAERHDAEIEVTTGTEDLGEANLPLIAAVGAAGRQAPRLIDITWGAPNRPRVTLVGKGVCFDTGGLNIKPGASMGLMKKDMGGAANVIGLAHMIMGLGLDLRLRVLIPAVENAISSEAMRPGDILRSRKGLTVEVNNTDAEGRLVLADALTVASEEDPTLLIDMATLTGAARVALGPDLAPYFTDDDVFARELQEASGRLCDPVWRMPLWPGYEGDIEPEIADLDNAPAGGMAGAITAALFLRRFADVKSWTHFDIYGWSPKERSGRPKGGEAQAIRALLAVLEARYADTSDD